MAIIGQRLRPVLWAGVALLLSIAATWPLTRHIGSALPRDLGDPLLNAWIIGWDADRLLHGLTGLWDAPILYPSTRTLAFSEHLLGLAIPVAPVVWLTGNPILAHNLAFLLTYPLALVGMFFLARFITTRGDAAGIAALAFAFAPARADQLAHIQVLASGWMAISLWALHRYFATFSARALALFALAFVWQAYSNGYFVYFLSLAVVIAGLVEVTARWNTLRQRFARTLVELSVAVAAMLLAMAPIISAYLDVRRIYGFRRNYRDLMTFSATVESYAHVAEPVRLWGRWLAQELAPERQLFPGLTVILLAALAILVRQPSQPPQSGGPLPARTYVWCYLAIAGVAFALSLGPEPTAWGARVLPFSPYLLLAGLVPGFDGLRVPARLSVVVHLGLCVLAGIGAAWLIETVRRHRKRATRAVAGLLGGIVILEGWAAPIPTAAFDHRGRESDRPLYEWLASSPPGAVLELPIKGFDISPTLTYQYATLAHHHPILNGYSGYGSALQSWLGGPTTPLNELLRMDVFVDMLQALGVRYVIVHTLDHSDRAFAHQTVESLRALGPQISEERTFGGTKAFRLSAKRKFSEVEEFAKASRPIPNSAFKATASHGAASLANAFDGNRDSRWITGRGQRGDEWVRLDFAEPTQIAGLRLMMSYDTVGEYPRRLAIEAIEESGGAVVLRTGPVLAALAAGLLENSAYPVIYVSLPRPASARTLIIRQTDRTGNLNWSIHELQVFR